MDAFSWINDFVLWLSRWCPRWAICEPTHAGVKFKGSFFLSWFGIQRLRVKRIAPGVYWWWPVKTTVQTMPVVRQSVDLPAQSVDTRDQVPIMVSVVMVVEISDVVKALTMNFDVEDTIADVGAAAATKLIACREWGRLRMDLAGGKLEEELLEEARSILSNYGVRVVDARLTDCVKHMPMRTEGAMQVVPVTEAEE